ncbi:MAG: hypothetical protein HXY23_04775 [Parvularculaceae bacterium]|nr:hypothetical protein [Parvularculaceae bacterium]
MSEDLPAKTAFDTLLERMKKDVAELEERSAAAPDEARAARLQGILDAAIREARNKGDAIRSNIADGTEALREEMRAHPGASISAAFAAGYMVGKAIAGRSRR